VLKAGRRGGRVETVVNAVDVCACDCDCDWDCEGKRLCCWACDRVCLDDGRAAGCVEELAEDMVEAVGLAVFRVRLAFSFASDA
jgi:hypothetical protein